jgi:ABC-type branched-subunit amino acid transport system substrate-binding protein
MGGLPPTSPPASPGPTPSAPRVGEGCTVGFLFILLSIGFIILIVTLLVNNTQLSGVFQAIETFVGALLGLNIFNGSSIITRWSDPHLYTIYQACLAPLISAAARKLPLLRTIYQKFLHPVFQRIYRIAQAVVVRPARKIGLRVFIIAGLILYSFFPGILTTILDVPCIYYEMPWHMLCGNGTGQSQMQVDNNLMTIGMIDENTETPFNPFDKNNNNAEKTIEKLIFDQNRQSASDPQHVTFIVVTTLSQTVPDRTRSVSLGLDDLRGAYLAQRDYNKYHLYKLRLLIANVGTGAKNVLDATVPLVAKRISLFAKSDATLMGVVGFPFSESAQVALDALSQMHVGVPIVSPSASDDGLHADDFYRVVAANSVETRDMVDFITRQMTPRPKTVVVFSDPGTPYSKSLGDDIFNALNDLSADSNNPDVSQVNYTAGDSDSMKQAIQDMGSWPDLIFFAGYADDLSTLEGLMKQYPTANYTSIMGGDALFELGGYSGGNYSRLYFATYAFPDNTYIYRDALGNVPDAKGFADEYSNTFDPDHLHCGEYGLSRPGPHVMLTYDATSVLLYAIDKLQLSGGTLSLEALQKQLKPSTFHGVTGQIHYEQSGDPDSKEILIVYVRPEGTAYTVTTYPSTHRQPYAPLFSC